MRPELSATDQRGLEVIQGPGVAATLPSVLRRMHAERVLVVATRSTLRRTGAHAWLLRHAHQYFHDAVPNPQVADVARGALAVARYDPHVVVGIGGGSVLDTAKAIRLLPSTTSVAERLVRGNEPVLPRRPAGLVLVPTTAGPGSEVTTFATMYIGTRKYSLDHPLVRADVALVDHELTHTCPPALTAHCAFDATAHAIESWWSARATPRSRELAWQALSLLVPTLRAIHGEPTPEQRAVLSDAAILAGRAIDLTRTTAAHAFAYPTTARFDVPHGLACALHLVWLLPLTLDGLNKAQSRVDIVSTGQVLALLGTSTPAGAGVAFTRLLRHLGCPTRLGEVGVRAEDLALIADDALGNDRTRNHPVVLSRAMVLRSLRSRL